jgi:3-oxoacyl-[acyl-carrier-protein] synthase II
VVTGLGALCALGPDVPTMWRAVLAGQSGIRPVDRARFDTGPYPTRLAGAVPEVDWTKHFSPRRLRRLDPCHRLAIVAAREALADGGLDPAAVAPRRAGLFVGTSLGGMLAAQRYDRERLLTGRRRRPLLLRYPLHVLADELARETGFLGSRSVVSTACTASTLALIQAIDAIRDGEVDVALAGGVDPLSEFTFAGFGAMQNVSVTPCAPFSTPEGLTLGEGAGFVLLERADRAEARGVRIYAELLGHALTADAYHATAPDPSGQSQRRLFEEALADAGVGLDEVDYVNAHGTGTGTNDAIESRVLGLLFGDRAGRVPVSSVKGALGHTLGAAGALEAIHAVLSVAGDCVPPTANFREARPGCELDYVPGRGRPHPVRVAVTQNFAFGGNNAAIVVGKAARGRGADVEVAAHDVVVTGMGVISALGIGREALLDGLRRGAGGIGRIGTFDTTALPVHLGAVVPDFDPARLVRADVRRMDRLGQFLVAAGALALKDAGLRVTRENAHRIGLVAGTQNGPIGSCAAFHRDLVLGPPQRANPKVFPNTVFNAGLGHAAVTLRVRGPNVVTTLGQASGVHALALACGLVRRGRVDVCVAGGADELLEVILEGNAVARTVSPLAPGGASGEEALRPFDRRRNGFVLGEGAALLVLESRAHAEARGAAILGRVAGRAVGADRPGPEGCDGSGASLAACMEAALAAAGVPAGAVDYVAAGALGLPRHDAVEAAALRRVFGRPVPTAALASVFGVSGAGTALAACAVLLGMAHGFQPAGVGSEEPDPACPVDLVTGAPRLAPIGAALVDGLSLGGSHACLVLTRAGA